MKKEAEIRSLFKESRTNIILGAKGAGKTNLVVCLIKLLVELGYRVYTNIHFFKFEEVVEAINRHKLPKGVYYRKKPDEIVVVSKLSELLYGLLEPGTKAVFIDEGGIVSPSGTSKDTTSVKQLAYIIRHFDCAFTIITQVATSVPPDLRERLVDYRLEVYKKGRTRRLEIGKRKIAEDEDGKKYIDFPTVKTFRKIPMASFPYDGDFPSSFKIDIDLKKALDLFGDAESSLELEKGEGKRILDKLTEPKTPSKKELILNYKKLNPKAKNKEIAKLFKTSEGYVKQI